MLLSAHYIGGVNEEGLFGTEWIWLDSGEPLNYTYWVVNASTDYECLIKTPEFDYDDTYYTTVDTPSLYTGKWKSTSCSDAYYFVCQSE